MSVDLSVVRFELIEEPDFDVDVMITPLNLPIASRSSRAMKYQFTGYERRLGDHLRVYRAQMLLAGPLEITIRRERDLEFERLLDERKKALA